MSFRDALASGAVLTLDGGTGSELRRRGLELSDVCWSATVNLEHGALLEAIHRDYIDAGAEIVTANTFGTARFVLEAAGLGERFEAINRAAIGAARRAADASAPEESRRAAGAGRKIAVAASLSCMPPRFERNAYPAPDEEYRAYAELALLFSECRVDLVLLEMLQDAPHAERACRAVRAAGLPFVAGLSCRLVPDHHGLGAKLVGFDDAALDFDRVIETVLPFAPDAIAIMHSPLDAMLPAIERLREVWPGPVGAWAEIPYPEDPAAAVDERLSPADYARAAQGWIASGARIIGGCCGTTPAHIAALASP